jgi:tRNA threonylcarbamoyladenosine biosynthesis protein TsaE
MTLTITTTEPAQTKLVAARLAKHLMGGEVIELSSDLGGGKTTFVQGLAAGLGYTGDVASPTFVISREYRISSSLIMHHYDLYRLGAGGVVGEELSEDVHDPAIVTVIEWAGVALEQLPDDRLVIEFHVIGDDSRELHFRSSGPKSDKLLKGIE